MQHDLALLIRQLRAAYSAELAAGYAYRGHWHSVRDAAERERIRIIEEEEWHHRRLVGGLLTQLGARPSRMREVVFYASGRAIAAFCRLGPWFAAMYGAGRLERANIVEYEDAALSASRCGHDEMIDCLLTMAEVEWEHEKYFREKVTGHWMLRALRLWEPPPAKETIRETFGVRRRQSQLSNAAA
ncbi:MAG TPA: demethoxyubiquinone hydroxylase family protein [Thermoanaerobaculia bacterium]|nr:demethoxyubiquinone hydroxylase family protein [Thermoanaerobaculia bacterium]